SKKSQKSTENSKTKLTESDETKHATKPDELLIKPQKNTKSDESKSTKSYTMKCATKPNELK
ncbi:8667_t:CDS:1, partial [Dentiscutata erythropus]